ncbi:MAG TPA: pantoate--beta-alanine ligase [Steroidobacteraceae bacterium]|nr:pantoate--beta-alanine ligase [Steroidobacteraceae bacterium]
MLVVERIDEVRSLLRGWREAGLTIGFVPTMGSLHAGHMSLLSAARFRADRVIASVFVNPLQFGPGEDFERYPRSPEDDARLLEDEGCEALFLPGVDAMYPKGRESATRVSVKPLSEILEGAQRPGHFDGVATVVAKLFGIVQPQVAVFGEKDYQQLAIIRRMVADLEIPVEIVGAQTVRSPDGLAMSSRNRYLSDAERARAPRIYATLRVAAERIHAGERNFTALSNWGLAELRAAQMLPDYFEIRDAQTLLAPGPDSRELVILTAARLGRARLIDNLRVAQR